MYRIITVEREYGCGAGEIARQLSSKLGWKLWDRELTAEIARVANVDSSAVSMCEERVDSAFQKLVNQKIEEEPSVAQFFTVAASASRSALSQAIIFCVFKPSSGIAL